jgi:CheY-like chemotaxis protein
MGYHALHVLVVEDHASTQQILVKMLGKLGHQVIAAKDGAEAEAMGTFQRFDLLISDIGLPGLNGWELLGKLRSAQPELRAIALTGFGYPKDVERSQEVGFDIHLTKPTDWPTVEHAVRSLFPEAAGNM